MSKGYTIQSFIDVLSAANTRKLTTVESVYNAVAPRGGFLSVKADALNSFLGNQTNAIVSGAGRFSSFGATPKARLLKALRNRQRTGSVFG